MKHLTCEQRYTIAQMHKKKVHYKTIADVIEVHPSTVLRELKRNGGAFGYYSHVKAQKNYLSRRKNSVKKKKFTGFVERYVLQRLEFGWSPEQIAGRAAKDGIFNLTYQAIYYHVKRHAPEYGQYLRFRGRRRNHNQLNAIERACERLKNKVGIHERPEAANLRSEFGHFEADTVVSKGRDAYFVTLTDRKTGFIVEKISKKDGETTAAAMIDMLRPWKPFVHTVTSDNGTEFSEHETISKELNISFYFARPYCSNDRASNENFNGLLRDYFPKNESFKEASPEYVRHVQNFLNDRPRKRLNWLTPREALISELSLN